jgi:catechol 2,3-dioxygenase-like lactoylglutathione lyase family enzyme
MAESIPLMAMSHVAMCVRNLDASLKFYRDLVGLQVVRDAMEEVGPAKLHLQGVYRTPHQQRRAVNLVGGPGSNVPMLAISEHPGDAIGGSAILLDEVGITHFSFTVASVDAVVRRFAAHGVEPCGPIIRDRHGNANVFFADPDGILVQFDEGDAA